MTAHWYDDRDNLLTLAEHLNENSFWDAPADVIYFFEKPWKFADEWDAYQEQRDAS